MYYFLNTIFITIVIHFICQLRTPEENNDQVFSIWSNCIRADDWKGIAKLWATNEINDKTVQENIETSFIATLCNSESASKYIYFVIQYS